jgi:DNA-directed RNA polymerase I, II, and III subunit RPABC2
MPKDKNSSNKKQADNVKMEERKKDVSVKKDKKKDASVKNEEKDNESNTKLEEKQNTNEFSDGENDDIAEENDGDENELEFDAEEDEFFDDNNFKDFNDNIQFRVFDPEKYENEMHNEIIIIPNVHRRTSEVITKYEFTDVVSNRAKQIENGSPIFVDIKDETNPIFMAEMEIRMKRCPLSIRRLISSNIAEIWEVNEMIIPY